MTDYTIPRANAPIAGQDAPTTQWYNFLRFLDTRTSSAAGDVQAEITTIATKLGSPDGTVDNIPALGNVTSVQGRQSIVSSGISVVQLRLVNDADVVAPIYYYGTDSTGTKGYNLLYSAFASTANIAKINTAGIVSFDLTDLTDSGAGTLLATTFDAKGRKTGSRAATLTTASTSRITIANPDASAGLPTFDLATVADAGGGTLQKTAFDAYGRKTGTSAATTSDLTEGSNLYFTTGRVLATLLAGLSTATSAVITAADSVLIAFGKLQAQITTLTASLAGYVPTTRTISTTAPLTGGGDLSANRTLAMPVATTSVDGYLAHADWATFNAKVPTSTTITAGAGLSGGGDLSANRTISMGAPSTLTGATANSASGTTHTHALTLVKADVGLGNVDNTSDANKPVSTAQQAAMDALSFKNRLINGDFAINQRVFAGGALAAGVYGFDRWKAGTGGCNVSLSGGVLTHTSGPLVQVMEAPGLASTTVTVSVEDPSGSISVDVDGVTGTITAGAGRRGVSIAVPSGSTGNVTLTLTATGVTYKRVQLEIGVAATAFEWLPMEILTSLCQRYFELSYPSGYGPGAITQAGKSSFAVGGTATTANLVSQDVPFAVKKMAIPAVTIYSRFTGTAGKLRDENAGADINGTAASASTSGFLWFGTTVGGQAGINCSTQWTADAEL